MNESRAVAFSQKFYERLLVVYPQAHREKYGPAMAQLFRDQCRDAWSAAGTWGLAKLWLRVLPDLLKTSIWEQLANLKGEQTMWQTIVGLTRFRYAPLAAFVAVFLAMVCATTAVSLLMHKTYAGKATLLLASDNHNEPVNPYLLQTEFEMIQSEVVLNKVIEDLDLKVKWGEKYTGKPFSMAEARNILRRVLNLRPIRNTKLVEINVYDTDKNEAANIANKIVEAYRLLAMNRQTKFRVDIVSSAQPALSEVRPNVPRNILLGIAGGSLLGGVLAGIIFLIGRSHSGASAKPTSTTSVTRLAGTM